MRVSILVPIYNVEKYFHVCLKSLFSQTYSDIEYVFVNDCTPDNSMSVLHHFMEKYPMRAESVKIIKNDKNEGIAKVRNSLIENATGDYFLFVDSDDWIEPDTVEILASEAKRTRADVVGCDYFEEYEESKVLCAQHYPTDHVEAMKAITLLRIKGVLWKLLIRRDLCVDNNLRFVPGIQFGEDYIFCCKLFYYAQTFSSVGKALYHYVQYNPNNYSSANIDSRISSFAKAIKEVEEFYREKGIVDELKRELTLRKFLAKSSYVLNGKARNLMAWSKIFPEANGAWRDLDYSLPNKLKFLFAEMLAKVLS